MAMAVGMVMTPAASGGAQQQRQHHPTFLPLMIGASQQRRGGSRGQTQWAPLTVRSIATGPPKSAAEVDWKTKREVLMKNKMRSVSAKEALRLQQEQGYVIVGVCVYSSTSRRSLPQSLSSRRSLVGTAHRNGSGGMAESQQRRAVAARATDDGNFFTKGTQFFTMRGRKDEEEEEEEPVAKGTQVFRLGGLFKKGREEEADVEEEEELRFGTQRFNFRALRGGVESGNGAASKGGTLVQQKKESTALDALPFGRGRRPDPKTVFVAGATGQIGARITQQLLRSGFNVRGGVRDLYFAQQLAEFSTQYGVISREEAKRLNAVEFDYKDVDSIAKALGNASKVVVTVGPGEDGPRAKVAVEDAIRVLEAAQFANASHFVAVYEPGVGVAADGPLAAISGFFNNLFNRGASGLLDDGDLIDKIVDTNLNFTFIRAGSTEGVDDYSLETSNLVVAAEGASDAGGKVSKIQVASVVAAVLENTNMSENKVLEVTSDPYASPRPLEEALSVISTDGRRAVLEAERAEAEEQEREQEAREQADAEVRAAAEEARRATELATQLEAEARKLAAEETRAAALAAKAQAKADAAAASVDGLTTKAKELGINTPAKTMAGVNFASFVPKLEDVGARFTKPKAEKPKKKEQIKSKSQPELAGVGAGAEPALKPQKQFFGGLFKQETVYMDDE